ncbi:DNA -binding domain-containing protein [Hyphomonas sp.]|uniref:DNA -binding domain-containing protein n=1 Tax=Hyphomonas sp. TaxID=87 RepID=UPI003918ADEF
MKTFTLESNAALVGYDYLSRLSMDRWAWEYLRRNHRFQRDYALCTDLSPSVSIAPCAPIRMLKSRSEQKLAGRWGLLFLPDPALNGFQADAVWSEAAYPGQVEIHCSPCGPGETCNLWKRTLPIAKITYIIDRLGREYLLVRGKGCVVQVRCTGLPLIGLEPVRMKFTLPDIEAYERMARGQKAVLQLYGDGPDLSVPLWTKTTQILRNGLIALDCLERGMSRREIAVLLYGEARVADAWNDDRGSLRDAVKYLVRKAEALRDGGYLMELLGAQIGPNQKVA